MRIEREKNRQEMLHQGQEKNEGRKNYEHTMTGSTRENLTPVHEESHSSHNLG